MYIVLLLLNYGSAVEIKSDLRIFNTRQECEAVLQIHLETLRLTAPTPYAEASGKCVNMEEDSIGV